MTINDFHFYVIQAQPIVDELKLMLVFDDLQQVLNKLDNMFMIFILHNLHKAYGSVWDRTLTNPSIPTVGELINCLIQIPPLGVDS